MATITIPKNLIKNDDLVVIPAKNTRNFINGRKRRNYLKHSRRQPLKRDLVRARKIETKVIF